MPVPIRPSSALGFRPPRLSTQNGSNTGKGAVEGTLLDENGQPLIGHLLAFTPDVTQVFQDAAKLIEESREIKKQATNQIKDAFNDAKAYSLTVNQSVAQKLADIITLAVSVESRALDCSTRAFVLATFDHFPRGEHVGAESGLPLVRLDHECSAIQRWPDEFIVLQNTRTSRSTDHANVPETSRQSSSRCSNSLESKRSFSPFCSSGSPLL